uniref:Secreted protein n=1 Tax=Globodera rostochiensis TaxID=31243 RepID=A0A914I0T1_GLORO
MVFIICLVCRFNGGIVFQALRQLCSICPDQQILDGPNDCLTMAAKNRLHSNAIWFREEDQQQQHQKVSGTAKNAKKTTIRGGRNKRSVVLQEQTRIKMKRLLSGS